MATASKPCIAPMPVPLTERVDLLCADYLVMKDEILAGNQKDLKSLKDQLVAILEKFGKVPDGAKKSLRIEGDKYEATASYHVSTSIDQVKVLQLATEMKKLGLQRLFKKLFHTDIKYVLSPTSEDTKTQLPKKLALLLAHCVVSAPNNEPSLKVDLKGKKAKGKKA